MSKQATLAVVLGAAASLAVISPCGAARSAPPIGQCIDTNGTSWASLDDHRILVRSSGAAFLVTTGVCPRLAAPLTHVVVDAPGGTPICTPHDARLYISGGGSDPIRTPCMMQSIEPLSRDQAKALEGRKP
jgi:hypothetical protein